jgi:16S rRNA (guanine527-N7)-methyltransferase
MSLNRIDPAIAVQTICRKNGLGIDDDDLLRFRHFVNLLLEWNQKINLISRKDTDNIWYNHLLHSLTILFHVPFPAGSKVLDLGTGGGLPGIPIAVLRDDVEFTLVDSIAKKTKAVSEMVAELNLNNVQVVTSRVEDLSASSRHRGHYDAVISRAVAPLAVLIRWSKPLLTIRRVSSKRQRTTNAKSLPSSPYQFPLLVALKGGDLQREIADARRLPGTGTIFCTDLVFDGSTELGLQDKKLVTVEF